MTAGIVQLVIVGGSHCRGVQTGRNLVRGERMTGVPVLVTAVGEVIFFLVESIEEDERLAWCEWLRQHSIDPGEVPGPSYIEIDRKAWRIRHLSYDLNDKGGRFPLPDYRHASVSVREVQLDAPIADLPVTTCHAHGRLDPDGPGNCEDCLLPPSDDGWWNHGVD